eukprot:4859546-Amphidinium_carterae.1
MEIVDGVPQKNAADVAFQQPSKCEPPPWPKCNIAFLVMLSRATCSHHRGCTHSCCNTLFSSISQDAQTTISAV